MDRQVGEVFPQLWGGRLGSVRVDLSAVPARCLDGDARTRATKGCPAQLYPLHVVHNEEPRAPAAFRTPRATSVCLVEVAGFEPASECTDRSASTSLARALYLGSVSPAGGMHGSQPT